MDGINHDDLELLGDLYAITNDDWLIEIEGILTEPVCPTCLIRTERDKTQPRFHFVGDSIEEAVNSAVAAAVKHFGLRATLSTPTGGSDGR